MYDHKHTYILIMAGGAGTRFWPASRESRPKQFLDILGTGRTLLQMTYDRFLPLVALEHIFVLSLADYRELIKEQLPLLPENNIIIEPIRNNTAPCVAYAAFKLHGLDEYANIVIAPADHLITKEDLFLQIISEALDYTAQHPAIITLGIHPARPETGYGYIEKDAAVDGHNFSISRVASFKEKPDLATAKKYLEKGRYFWNAGLFIFSTATILDSFKDHAPEIFKILEPGVPHYNTGREETFVRSQYPLTPNISIDYAVMEKATNIYVIGADIGWSDLGTWSAIHAQLPADDQGNAVVSGQVYFEGSKETLVRVDKNKLVVIRGLNNYMVVEDDDVLLIYPQQDEQDIKQTRLALGHEFGTGYF